MDYPDTRYHVLSRGNKKREFFHDEKPLSPPCPYKAGQSLPCDSMARCKLFSLV